jgi:hypothetical protein
VREPANDRRLGLFTLAAGRRLWKLLDDEASRRAVEVAWRQAEGLVTVEESEGSFAALRPVYASACQANFLEVAQVVTTLGLLLRDPPCAAMTLIRPLITVGQVNCRTTLLTEAELTACCWLLRDILGSLRRPAGLPRELFAWNDGRIVHLAQACYIDRAFDRLPVLADALEDAGCDDADVLSHCRGGKEHVRGCWVVDLLLGKG